MIGHSLGRIETCFGPSTQGAGTRHQNTSQIQILRLYSTKTTIDRGIHIQKLPLLKTVQQSQKRGAMYEFGIDGPTLM